MSIENVLCTHSIIIHGIYTLVAGATGRASTVLAVMLIQLPQCMVAAPVVAKVVATGEGISAELQGKCGDMAS